MSVANPFMQVHGSLALPRSRPFDTLPDSFGCEWTVRAPTLASLRSELRTLYAAVLRTFCLTDDQFLSICRWNPLRRTQANAALTPDDAPIRVNRADVELEDLWVARRLAAPRNTKPHWRVIAACAGVAGSAALAAWALWHDDAQHTGNAAPVHGVNATVDESPRALPAAPANVLPFNILREIPHATHADRREIIDRMREARHATQAEQAVPHVAANAAASDPHANRTASVVMAKAASAKQIASPREAAKRNKHASVATRTPSRREHATPVVREPSKPRLAARYAVSTDPVRVTRPVTTQRTRARASSAGAFSPAAPSALDHQEYADVGLSARTHMRGLRPETARPVDVNRTDWMNNMSQRRVTEVPDQFSR